MLYFNKRTFTASSAATLLLRYSTFNISASILELHIQGAHGRALEEPVTANGPGYSKAYRSSDAAASADLTDTQPQPTCKTVTVAQNVPGSDCHSGHKEMANSSGSKEQAQGEATGESKEKTKSGGSKGVGQDSGTNASEIKPGDKIGDYTVTGIIGSGVNGKVFKAFKHLEDLDGKDSDSKKYVALKKLSKEKSLSLEDLRLQFGVTEAHLHQAYASPYPDTAGKLNIRQKIEVTQSEGGAWDEADIQRKLHNHPNVLKVVKTFTVPNLSKPKAGTTTYMALDLASAGDLLSYLVETTEKGKSLRGDGEAGLPEELTRKLFRELIGAVHHCHKNGYNHGDLKPENILLEKDDKPNGKGEVKLLLADFGGSCFLDIHSEFQRRYGIIDGDGSNGSSSNGSSSKELQNQIGRGVLYAPERGTYIYQPWEQTVLNVHSGEEKKFARDNPVHRDYMNAWYAHDMKHLSTMRRYPGGPGWDITGNQMLGFRGVPVDIYGCGLLLYAMGVAMEPFDNPDNAVGENCVAEFYNRKREGAILDIEDPRLSRFRHLIEAMMRPNPDLRPTIRQIVSDPWFREGMTHQDFVELGLEEFEPKTQRQFMV